MAYGSVVVQVLGSDGKGSGLIFDAKGETGFVITAYHVVAGGSPVSVLTPDGFFPATILGYDPDLSTDVAVLSICCASFDPLPWQGATQVIEGDPVWAAGYSDGIGSGLAVVSGRVWETELAEHYKVVAHDAPIQPGFSGGPLLSEDLKVVGINIADAAYEDGLHYATPFRKVADDLALWIEGQIAVAPTPESTAISMPTPVPTLPSSTVDKDCTHPAVVRYAAASSEIMDDLEIGRRDMVALLSQLADDETVMSDTLWNIGLDLTLARIGGVPNRLERLDPPAVLKPGHAIVLDAAAKLREFEVFLSSGLEKFDAGLIADAAEKMGQANELFAKAGNTLLEICS